MNAMKQTSEQAQVAKLIKKYCTSKGIKCRATSDSFSMGDSVDVYIDDQSPAVVKDITDYAKQYQSGSFNSMEDIYEYDNRNRGIPQSKFVSINNEYSQELKQAAWDVIRAHYADTQDAPASIDDAHNFRLFDQWADTVIFRFLNGSEVQDELSVKFWAERTTPKKPASTVVSSSSVTIEEHTHTKRGFQMFIVVMADRVERAEYLSLLEKAKVLGGWYTRKWGTTPAGFAFKSNESAAKFAELLSGVDTPSATPQTGTVGLAAKFRTLAGKMQTDIDHKFADRLTNTHKRQREAGSARLEGEKLQRTQQALNVLADMHEAGEVPAVLMALSSKKAVYELMTSEKLPMEGCYDVPICTGEPRDDSPAALALWSLITGKTDDAKKADELRRMVEAVQFVKIPGYFPTPDALIDRMIVEADINKNLSCLEPSAGSGAIADKMRDIAHTVDCVEINFSLRDILTAKGHTVTDIEFITAEITKKYDRIVMNPPFEKLQDIDHVMKAFECLNDHGVLVSIMSPAPFFISDKKAIQFREWFDSLGGERQDIEAGAFKESGTGVASVMVILRK